MIGTIKSDSSMEISINVSGNGSGKGLGKSLHVVLTRILHIKISLLWLYEYVKKSGTVTDIAKAGIPIVRCSSVQVKQFPVRTQTL